MTKMTEEPSKSHPLKGIINSNDDPWACAACSQPMDLTEKDESFVRVECCGKWTCLECEPILSRVKQCPFCSWPVKRSQTEIFAKLKKMAKKGYAWAQFEFGDVCYDGSFSVKPSHAFRWFSKASKKNHPQAHMLLGEIFMEGHGVAVDLAKAHRHLKSAMSFGVDALGLGEDCRANLATLAGRYMVVDAAVAKSILDQLIDTSTRGGGISDSLARAYRGELYVKDEDYSMASCMFQGAFLNGIILGIDMTTPAMTSSSMCAFMCAEHVGNVAQAAFWMRRIKISNLRNDSRRDAVEQLVNFRQSLRALRDTCGGCGAEFEGEERKFCRGCRAYCYCSRDCQKTHWNRKNDGHREDCKGLTELKQMAKEAKRMAMLGK